ncbi:MAG: ROK family protein [Oscillospiraceae bacterium]|nr:ROK family protein [Oscillospiraceae bacterium]
MYKLGVDLGGTNISVGVVDSDWKIVGRGSRKTLAGRPAEQVLADIAAACNDAIADAGLTSQQIDSIGLATPGSVEKDTGVITYANNLDFHHVPAREILQQWFSCPVYLDNDANCAALGEALAGSGRGVNSFIAVTLGTGVGGGIVIDGKIVNGCNDAAGEVGHFVIAVDGKPCNCGRRGCWESYSSATALIAQAKEAGLDIDGAKDVFDARDAGDARAAAVIDEYLRYLAAGVANLVNIFQPDKICFGGGVAYQGEALLVPLRKLVEAERYTRYAPVQTELVQACLGNDAGIVGAAALMN